RYLCQRFLTGFCKLYCFYLKFSRKCTLGLLHGPCPLCAGPLFQVYLPHSPGSRPVCLSERYGVRMEAGNKGKTHLSTSDLFQSGGGTLSAKGTPETRCSTCFYCLAFDPDALC